MTSFRKLLPGDRDRLIEHLLRLDKQSRFDRFSGSVSEESVRTYAEGLRFAEDIVLGWFEAGELRATAHIAVTKAFWPREAELALTVEPGWQDRGIGSSLCREALLTARNRMIGRIWLVCLMENVRIQRIVRKLEGSLLYVDGSMEGSIVLPPPNGVSLWQEAFGAGGALVDTLIDQWRPVMRVESEEEELRAPAA